MGPMLERSGNGPYAKLANSVAKATENSYNSGSGSSSKVIADIVSKAVIARKPKTRYVAGQFAAPMILIRKWFGDRIFDWVIMSRVK